MKKIGLIILLIIAIAIIFVIYWNITYIDNTVTQGQVYGFKIGDSKEITYQKARKIYAGKVAYILYPLDSNSFGPHYKFNFSDNDYQLIADRNQWEFLFNEKHQDFIKLSFENKSLISIYRHRQQFELP